MDPKIESLKKQIGLLSKKRTLLGKKARIAGKIYRKRIRKTSGKRPHGYLGPVVQELWDRMDDLAEKIGSLEGQVRDLEDEAKEKALDEKIREDVYGALENLGVGVYDIMDSIYLKEDVYGAGKGITTGEQYLQDNLCDLEFCLPPSSKDLDAMLLSAKRFAQSAEQILSDLDGDHDWPNGKRTMRVITRFLKRVEKYLKPAFR